MPALVIALSFVYVFMVGATHAALVSRGWRSAGDDPATFIASAAWPLTLPALLGAAAVRHLTATRRHALPEERAKETRQ